MQNRLADFIRGEVWARRYSLTTIVWSRSGPTDTISIGWPTSSLIRVGDTPGHWPANGRTSGSGDFFLPARQRLINGLSPPQVVDMAREARRIFAVDAVGGADFQLIEAAQHVEQHDRDRIHATQPAGVPHGHHIEPAAAPRAARNGAVFIAAVAQVLAGGVVLLGGNGPPPTRVE